MKRLLLLIVLGFLLYVPVQAQIFSQSFTSSTTTSSYVNSTVPSAQQFTFFSNYGNSTASIAGGKLVYTKTTTSGSTQIVRNADFIYTPSLMMFKFKFECVAAVSSSPTQTNHAALIIGENFINDATLPSDNQTNTRLGFFFNSDGSFNATLVNNTALPSNAAVITSRVPSSESVAFFGEQQLALISNNTGTDQVYIAPDLSEETVANDTWDLWIGTTKVFNNVAAVNGNVAMKNFRFSAVAQFTSFSIKFDDFEVYDLSDILSWNFAGTSSAISGAVNSSIKHPNLQVSALKRGDGLAEASFNNSYFSTFINATATKAEAVTNQTFYSFTVNTKSNQIVSLNKLNSKVRRNGSGPAKILWQYSTDGLNFNDLGAEVDLGTTSDGEVQTPIDLSGIAALQNIPSSTTVVFRVLGWSASAGGGFAVGRITDGAAGNAIALNGRVEHESVLPVTLTSFKAAKANNAVQLSWITASEQNNSHFNILRAGNDQNFVSIANVKGSGTASTSKTYNLTDYRPLAGSNYYKLTQTDFNGNPKEVGNVQYVQFDLNSTSLTVLQMADHSTVKALLNAAKAENVSIGVYNISGSNLYKTSLALGKGLNELTLPANLSRGVYILQVKTQSGEALRAKFVR